MEYWADQRQSSNDEPIQRRDRLEGHPGSSGKTLNSGGGCSNLLPKSLLSGLGIILSRRSWIYCKNGLRSCMARLPVEQRVCLVVCLPIRVPTSSGGLPMPGPIARIVVIGVWPLRSWEELMRLVTVRLIVVLAAKLWPLYYGYSGNGESVSRFQRTRAWPVRQRKHIAYLAAGLWNKHCK